MDAIPLYDASTPMADDHQEEQDSRDNNNNSSGEQNSEPKEQNLLSLANTCSKKLSALWERTGISPEQRQAKLQQLLGDISAVYQAQISAEETRRNALLETLGAKTASLVQLCARLEIDHEEFCKRKEDERMEALETGSNASNISDLMDEPTLHEQIAAIEEHRQELGEMQEVKGKEARELLSQVFALWDRLGTPLNEPGYTCEVESKEAVSDLSSRRFQDLNQKIREANEQIAMKLKHVEDKADEVCALLEDLAVEDEDMTELDRRIFSNESAESLGVHSSLIARLEQRCYELITVRVGREETLKALALEITSLWKQLCIPEELRQEFLARHEGLGLATLQACEKELDRLLGLKQESLHRLIGEDREELELLWEQCCVSQAQKEAFAPFFADDFTDEVLSAHQAAVAEWRERAEAMKPLLSLVQRRDKIRADMLEFQKTCRDPNRFKIPGLLLKEEKARKKFKHTLPKLETKLVGLLSQWETERGEAFTVNGVRYLDIIETQAEESRLEKESTKTQKDRAKQARKQASACTPNRPRHNAHMHVNMAMPSSRHSNSDSNTKSSNDNDVPSTPRQSKTQGRSRMAHTTGGKTRRAFSRVNHNKMDLSDHNSNGSNDTNGSSKFSSDAKSTTRCLSSELAQSPPTSKRSEAKSSSSSSSFSSSSSSSSRSKTVARTQTTRSRIPTLR